MTNSSSSIDLLYPTDIFHQNYVHQLRQTIEAYSDSMLVIGEALQNAIDAVCELPKPKRGIISLTVDFDSDTVTVRDNGVGFPDNLSLLYLGGSLKKNTTTKTKGKIGVGIKVTMFSSEYFYIRSNTQNSAWKIEVNNAHDFENLSSLSIPTPLPNDPSPLPDRGTEVSYRFTKTHGGKNYLDYFVDEIISACVPKPDAPAFLRTIKDPTMKTNMPSPFAALFSSFLQRFSYVGDVLASLGHTDRYPKDGIDINCTIKCTNPQSRFTQDIADLFGQTPIQRFSIKPSYLSVMDTLQWVPPGKKAPRQFEIKLGPGGSSLSRVDGFNTLLFASHEDYEALLLDKKGKLPNNISLYREKLFPKVNGMLLTIGRIPDLETFLPGGSRRVVSCNGVVTSHDIDLTRGRNQEYVRCIDLVIDVDADLNYGKNQLTNMHLVKWLRDYVNEAYVRVLQNATGSWVGRITSNDDDEDDEIFVARPDIGLPNYTSCKQPRDENDVIGLFFEMAGKGVFPKYRIYGLSQKDKYDGRAAIKRECDPDSVLEPVDDTKLRVIEFKQKAAEIIRDFDRGQKNARDVDLVIAWEVGSYESRDFAIYDIDQSAAYQSSPKRVFPLVTKYIYDSRDATEVQILLLKDIVEELLKTS